MHVFVTGATGFVGLHTVLELLAAGHTVRLGVRNAEKMQALYAAHGIEPVDFAVGEITDKTSVDRALDGCDGVVHTAALVSLDPGQAELMHRTNVTGTRLVVGGAVERGCKSVVYVSSAASLFDPARSVLDESAPLANPRSAYARSKVDAEQFVQALVEQGAPVAITYPTAVVGPDDPAMSEGNQSLRFILRHLHVNTSTGLQVIDVRDLARAQRLLLEGGHSGRYVVAGHFAPWREVGDLLREVTGRRLRALPVPGPVMRAVGSAVDLLGLAPRLETPITREAMDFATRWVFCDDSKLRDTLKMDYRPIAQTFADTARWLAEAGHVDPAWAENIRD